MHSQPAAIGRYEVVRLLGRGGMGEVFLARDPVLDRQVAVKLINGDLDTTRSRERLVREARAAGRLRHPNIVTIFDAGEHDDRPFIAMEFVRGETLGSLIRRQAPIPLVRRLELIEGACAGLSHAHRHGVVHLDIKPDNLMLDESGIVKVLDFGIARVLQSGLLVTRQLGGTLRYMSPEQIEGRPLDHRSDVFSLGCALFEMITFVPAFVGSTKDIVTQIANGPVPALREAMPQLPPRLDAVVRRAMALDRTQRYGTLDELQADLTAARKDLDPDYNPCVAAAAVDTGLDEIPTMPVSHRREAEQVSSIAQPAGKPRRSLVSTLVVVTGLVAAGTIWILRQDGPPPSSSREAGPAAPVIVDGTRANEAPSASPPITSTRDARGEVARGATIDRGTQAADSSTRTPGALPGAAAEPEPAIPFASPSEEPARGPVPPPRPTLDTAAGEVAVSNAPVTSAPAPGAKPAPDQPRADHDAVRETLRRYEAAYRALDVNAILRVYPSLGGDQARQLQRTFETVTQYEIDIRNPQIEVQAETAVVRATLARRITPRVGNPLINEVVNEFRLRREGGAWVIVAVAAR
jgi:serine/threonine-protein kinase